MPEEKNSKQELIDRLAAFSKLQTIPREELAWLAENGYVEARKAGEIVAAKGARIENLYIILAGKMSIHIDRGAGPKLVQEWQPGDVSGILPYSRMVSTPGNTIVENDAEFLVIKSMLFPEMIHKCPGFTAHAVHLMLDRARNFNTSDLQDEKLMSLGKLAAGLAHELNNPASVAVSNAKNLVTGLSNLDSTARALGSCGLSEIQIQKIEHLRTSCLTKPVNSKLSPIQKADRQEEIAEWLANRRLNPEIAISLSDTSVTIEALNALIEIVPADVLDIVIKWIAASCAPYALAIEMEQAAKQIYRLVDAVKKFTYMDNLTDKEVINLEPGIRDTVAVLVSKIKLKNASISIDIEKSLPRVCANGSELNQVWLSLIDNALDAIQQSGNIQIKASADPNRVVVRVIDNGPGIPEEMLPRIFDPFFTTKAPGQGTGLGLDITQRLLRRFQGDISVESVPGKTEFRVSLIAEKS